MEGEPPFLHYLRYRIKSGNKGLEYTIWRKEEFRYSVNSVHPNDYVHFLLPAVQACRYFSQKSFAVTICIFSYFPMTNRSLSPLTTYRA